MAAGGFDGEADFAIDARFALPFIMAPDDFVLHAGGELFFQQRRADALGFFAVGRGGGDDHGFVLRHFRRPGLLID